MASAPQSTRVYGVESRESGPYVSVATAWSRRYSWVTISAASNSVRHCRSVKIKTIVPRPRTRRSFRAFKHWHTLRHRKPRLIHFLMLRVVHHHALYNISYYNSTADPFAKDTDHDNVQTEKYTCGRYQTNKSQSM